MIQEKHPLKMEKMISHVLRKLHDFLPKNSKYQRRFVALNLPGTRAAVINVIVRERMDTVVVVLHLSLSRVDRNHNM